MSTKDWDKLTPEQQAAIKKAGRESMMLQKDLWKENITVLFGGKAAPAYIIAQDIIHLILCLSEIINNDPEVNKYSLFLF